MEERGQLKPRSWSLTGEMSPSKVTMASSKGDLGSRMGEVVPWKDRESQSHEVLISGVRARALEICPSS